MSESESENHLYTLPFEITADSIINSTLDKDDSYLSSEDINNDVSEERTSVENSAIEFSRGDEVKNTPEVNKEVERLFPRHHNVERGDSEKTLVNMSSILLNIEQQSAEKYFMNGTHLNPNDDEDDGEVEGIDDMSVPVLNFSINIDSETTSTSSQKECLKPKEKQDSFSIAKIISSLGKYSRLDSEDGNCNEDQNAIDIDIEMKSNGEVEQSLQNLSALNYSRIEPELGEFKNAILKRDDMIKKLVDSYKVLEQRLTEKDEELKKVEHVAGEMENLQELMKEMAENYESFKNHSVCFDVSSYYNPPEERRDGDGRESTRSTSSQVCQTDDMGMGPIKRLLIEMSSQSRPSLQLSPVTTEIVTVSSEQSVQDCQGAGVIEDLNLQISDLSRKLESNMKYLNEQTTEREFERDESFRRITELENKFEEIKKDKEHLETVIYNQKMEIDDYEVRLKETTESEQDLLAKAEKSEDELKQAVDKIFELREIIRDLEDQIDSVTNDAVGLKEQTEFLREEVERLESEKKQQEQNMDSTQDTVVTLVSDVTEEIYAQVQDLTVRLVKKLNELDNFPWGTRPNSSCSGGLSASTEEISVREVNYMNKETETTPLQLAEGLRQLEIHFDSLVRFEEVVMKKLKDTELRLAHAKKREEELENEKPVYLESMQAQTIKISDLESRLDQFRFQPSPNTVTLSGLRSRVTTLTEEVEEYRGQIQLKNIEMKELMNKLEVTQSLLAKHTSSPKHSAPIVRKSSSVTQTYNSGGVRRSNSSTQTDRDCFLRKQLSEASVQTTMMSSRTQAIQKDWNYRNIGLDTLELSTIQGGPAPNHSTPNEVLEIRKGTRCNNSGPASWAEMFKPFGGAGQGSPEVLREHFHQSEYNSYRMDQLSGGKVTSRPSAKAEKTIVEEENQGFLDVVEVDSDEAIVVPESNKVIPQMRGAEEVRQTPDIMSVLAAETMTRPSGPASRVLEETKSEPIIITDPVSKRQSKTPEYISAEESRNAPGGTPATVIETESNEESKAIDPTDDARSGAEILRNVPPADSEQQLIIETQAAKVVDDAMSGAELLRSSSEEQAVPKTYNLEEMESQREVQNQEELYNESLPDIVGVNSGEIRSEPTKNQSGDEIRADEKFTRTEEVIATTDSENQKQSNAAEVRIPEDDRRDSNLSTKTVDEAILRVPGEIAINKKRDKHKSSTTSTNWEKMENQRDKRLKDVDSKIMLETAKTQLEQLQMALENEKKKTAYYKEQVDNLQKRLDDQSSSQRNQQGVRQPPPQDYDDQMQNLRDQLRYLQTAYNNMQQCYAIEKAKADEVVPQLQQLDMEYQRAKRAANELQRELNSQHKNGESLIHQLNANSAALAEQQMMKSDLMAENQALKNDILQLQTQVGNLQNAAVTGPQGRPATQPSQGGSRTFEQYLRAKSFRKALTWQKKYLIIVIHEYKDILRGNGSLGAHPDLLQKQIPLTPTSIGLVNRQSMFARFRIVGRVVIVTIRMKWMVHRWTNKMGAGCTSSTVSSKENSPPLVSGSSSDSLSPPTTDRASRLPAHLFRRRENLGDTGDYVFVRPRNPPPLNRKSSNSTTEVQHNNSVFSPYFERFEYLEGKHGATSRRPK